MPAEAREDVGTPDTGVSEGCKPPCGLSLSPPEMLSGHVSSPKALSMLAPTQTPSPVSPLLPPPWLLKCLFSLPRKVFVAFHWQQIHSSQQRPLLSQRVQHHKSKILDKACPLEDLRASVSVHSQARPSFATLSFSQGWALVISMCAVPLPRLLDCSSSCVPS